MPVITLASPKGGVGKSTTAVILATELAHAGATVSLIDADANAPLVAWSRLGAIPDRISVFGDVTERGIIGLIDRERTKSAFVIIDLEGSKNLKMSRAIGRADFVLIPATGSQLEGIASVDAINLVREEEVSFGRAIPHAVAFTRGSPAIKTRDERNIRQDLTEGGATVFDTGLHLRAAFRALFSYGGGLRDLPESEVRGVDKAIENAEAFTSELVTRLEVLEGNAA